MRGAYQLAMDVRAADEAGYGVSGAGATLRIDVR